MLRMLRMLRMLLDLRIEPTVRLMRRVPLVRQRRQRRTRWCMTLSTSIRRMLPYLGGVQQTKLLQSFNFRNQCRIVNPLRRALIIHAILLRLLMSGP
jgi:hypothetical protein